MPPQTPNGSCCKYTSSLKDADLDVLIDFSRSVRFDQKFDRNVRNVSKRDHAAGSIMAVQGNDVGGLLVGIL